MKPLYITFFFIITLFSSCQSQKNLNNTILNYDARTRGFHLTIQLENKLLEITQNGQKKKVELTNQQLKAILDMVSKIDFNTIKSKISIEKLATDKVISSTFNLNYKNKKYNFTFEHHNLPLQIKNILNKLQEFIKLKE